MLTLNDITQWGITHPWVTPAQIEQDLLLTRAICEIAQHRYLGSELVFRGGTALHKLHLPQPYRYSEDLDYVRVSGGGIAKLSGSLLDLGRDLGFDVKSKISEHPKIFWRAQSQNGSLLRIKIEINTHERSHALPLELKEVQVDSRWWSGKAQVPTFQLPELAATKLRALFQRNKGRDLFDLWLMITVFDLDVPLMLQSFQLYRPDKFSGKRAIVNLGEKLKDPDFATDLHRLVVNLEEPYNPEKAAELVIESILKKV